MQTLLIISASAFVAGTLAWFFIWALWTHPPEGWFGRDVTQLVYKYQDVRSTAWYRVLRIVTVVFGVISFSLLARMIAAHPW